MNSLKLFVASALLLLPWATLHAGEVPIKKPNVIYIMADELGYYEPGFNGGTNIKTPNLDRMAAEGMRFKNIFAGSSVCAPTRCCLMTGKHSGHSSVRINGGGTPLRADETTIASMLKPLGYATGGFGKWGCGGRDSTGVPEKHGFDLFFGYYDQVHAHTYYPPYLIRNSEEVPLAGNNGGSQGQTYSHYLIHDAAMKFIREHGDKQEPFFAYLPYTPPHGNFDIPDSDAAWEVYKDKPWPENARRYAAMVSMVDRQVGEVLALLKELGIERNTLVMFSGDNGGADYFASAKHPRGEHSANKNPQTGVEYRGTKGTLYEGGLRVPFLARWPSKIAPNSVSEHLGFFPDVLPTIAELTGAKAPADVDGLSLLPTLLGENAVGHPQQTHDFLYWEIAGATAIRQGTWRAVRPKPSSKWELYDLAADPSESQDLAPAHPEIVGKFDALAAKAHIPAVEGTFTRTDRHERDRRAKFGQQDNPNAAEPVVRPNIVLIFVDDLGYGDIGPFGATRVKTPQLDKFADEGMKFTSFYATPVCSMSRASLMTGCYNARVSIPGVLFPGSQIGLNSDEITLAEVLKQQGYSTICIGKWHLGHREPFLPTKQGFDAYFGIPYSNDMSIDTQHAKFAQNCLFREGMTEERARAKAINQNVPLMRDEEIVEYPADQTTLTQRYTAEATKFIRAHKATPFFVYLPHTMVHEPLAASDRFRGKSKNGLLGDAIEELDWSVGEIMRTIQELQLDEKTLVIFTSDNGAAVGSSAPWRGKKGSNFEGGVREPCLMRWPGRIPAGTTCDRIAGNIDLLPTFAKLVGVEPAKDRVLDGRDIATLMFDPKAGPVRDTHLYFTAEQNLAAIRQGDWKLFLATPANNRKEKKNKATKDANGEMAVTGAVLYNLATDPSEAKDVATEHPEVVAALQAEAERRETEIKEHRRPSGQLNSNE